MGKGLTNETRKMCCIGAETARVTNPHIPSHTKTKSRKKKVTIASQTSIVVVEIESYAGCLLKQAIVVVVKIMQDAYPNKQLL